MSKSIVKHGQTYLATTDDRKVRKDVGEALVIAGGGGLVLWGAATLLPFVGPLLLMILAVLGGLAMVLKK